MKLARSLNAFRKVFHEDSEFRRLGRPPGWSVYYHYLGRWYDRKGKSMPLQVVPFAYEGQRIAFEMSDRYLGAFKGVFLDREYDCGNEFVRSPRRILDLGGNIGFGSVYLANLFPQAEFAVVEPDPRNIPLLQRNLEANKVKAGVVAGAIGPQQGTLALRFGDNPTCSSLTGTGMHELGNSVEVPVFTVGDVLKRMGWTFIDLVKIDIEGAEEALLASDNGWLKHVGALLVEIHPNTTVERLNGYIEKFGFKLVRHGRGREPVYFARKGAR